ncbi:uncharacterized protein METZ01_LOCUS348111, partial [marine metagenome]
GIGESSSSQGEHADHGWTPHFPLRRGVVFAVGGSERVRGHGLDHLCPSDLRRFRGRLPEGGQTQQQGIARKNEAAGAIACGRRGPLPAAWADRPVAHRGKGQCSGKRFQNDSTLGSLLQGSRMGGDALGDRLSSILSDPLRVEQRHQLNRRPGRSGDRLHRDCGHDLRSHGLRLGECDHFRLPAHKLGAGDGGVDGGLRGPAGRMFSFPVVQRPSGGSIHGGYGFVGNRRAGGCHCIDDPPAPHFNHRGRHLRDGGRVGHPSGRLLQAHGQSDFPNVAHSSSLRAEGVEGNQGGNPLLDSFPPFRHCGFGDLETKV